MSEKNVVPLQSERHEVGMPAERNPWERYGDEVQTNRIVGELLKFSKGEWVVGRDMIEVEIGTRMVAGVDAMQVGWTKWVDGKPVDQRMGFLRDNYQVLRRSALPDTDREQWAVDERSGKPRDPWQFSNRFTLMDQAGQLFTFPTQSAGGVDACSNLSALYGKHVRSKPEDLPVVALERSSYMHPNREFGKIYKPVFRLTGWTSRKAFDAALKAFAEAAVEGEDEAFGEHEGREEASPAPAAQRLAPAKDYAAAKGRRARKEVDIPF